MKIFIVGAGFTGVQLAKRLINEKHDVVLIDSDAEAIGHLGNRLDCTVVAADGNSLSTLEEAGIAKADALVCVTGSDEVNMITCSLVESIFPDLLKIARVRNFDYYSNTQSHHSEARPLYGIDHMINPDTEAADAIVNALEHGAVMESLLFGDSGYEIVRISVEAGSKMDGQSLQSVRGLTEKKFIVAYVEHGDDSSLPSGATRIEAGDRIGILLEKEDVPEIAQLCGSQMRQLNKIALIGAGRIGTLVAENIFKSKSRGKSKVSGFSDIFKKLRGGIQSVLIVDSDRIRAREASEKFPSAKVYKADVTDEGFIEEEGIAGFDIAVCTTDNYEMNMVLSAYLESLGVKRSVALVASSSFSEIAYKLGVDVAVPVRDTVVDSIMSHLRGKSVLGIHTVSESGIEIIECELPPSSPACGKMLKEIASPGEFLVLLTKGAQSQEYQIPRGDTALEAGGSLVLITAAGKGSKVMERLCLA